MAAKTLSTKPLPSGGNGPVLRSWSLERTGLFGALRHVVAADRAVAKIYTPPSPAESIVLTVMLILANNLAIIRHRKLG